jgi:hypothetical protein
MSFFFKKSRICIIFYFDTQIYIRFIISYFLLLQLRTMEGACRVVQTLEGVCKVVSLSFFYFSVTGHFHNYQVILFEDIFFKLIKFYFSHLYFSSIFLNEFLNCNKNTFLVVQQYKHVYTVEYICSFLCHLTVILLSSPTAQNY